MKIIVTSKELKFTQYIYLLISKNCWILLWKRWQSIKFDYFFNLAWHNHCHSRKRTSLIPKIPAYNTCKRINCYCISFKFLRFCQMNFIRPKRSLENTRPRLRFYFIRGSVYKLFNLIFILNLFANKPVKKKEIQRRGKTFVARNQANCLSNLPRVWLQRGETQFINFPGVRGEYFGAERHNHRYTVEIIFATRTRAQLQISTNAHIQKIPW